ncbi:MAG: hypothetical protein EBY22_15630 [Gammaproteobacteria bacterium]|nr:hypothetical protein [Gammaproteobacteria bacterium]
MNNKFYLYIKQHKITGLKYFGMTATKDPYVYLGSGKYWRRHLAAHGKDIDTTNVWEFDSIESCEKFAVEFSISHNIVESVEWANLRPENGRDGRAPGSPGLKKEKNPNWGKSKEQTSFYGKKHTPENILFFKNMPKRLGGNNHKAKKVNTPVGQFACQKDAAKALNICRETLRMRIKNNISGFSYE